MNLENPLSKKLASLATAAVIATTLPTEAFAADKPTTHTINAPEQEEGYNRETTAAYNPNSSKEQQSSEESLEGGSGGNDGTAEVAFIQSHKEQLKNIFSHSENSANFISGILEFIDSYNDTDSNSPNSRDNVTRALVLACIVRNENPTHQTISDETMEKLRLALPEKVVSEAYHIHENMTVRPGNKTATEAQVRNNQEN